jgi:hypothetical protein
LIPGQVMWDLWWTKWHWGRFSPSISVSPANSHSISCSTLIIVRGWYSGPTVCHRVDSVSPRPMTRKTRSSGENQSPTFPDTTRATLRTTRPALFDHKDGGCVPPKRRFLSELHGVATRTPHKHLTLYRRTSKYRVLV